MVQRRIVDLPFATVPLAGTELSLVFQNGQTKQVAASEFAGIIIGHTVAGLPVGGAGMRLYVTDALAPAFGVIVVGGGSVTIPVFHNGTSWIAG